MTEICNTVIFDEAIPGQSVKYCLISEEFLDIMREIVALTLLRSLFLNRILLISLPYCKADLGKSLKSKIFFELIFIVYQFMLRRNFLWYLLSLLKALMIFRFAFHQLYLIQCFSPFSCISHPIKIFFYSFSAGRIDFWKTLPVRGWIIFLCLWGEGGGDDGKNLEEIFTMEGGGWVKVSRFILSTHKYIFQ